jgi:DNA-binding transcriptional regulator GbsR (MarR family)
MRILLTTREGPLDAARIADEAGFAKRNVSEVLTALVETDVVKARWSRNERVFLVYRDKWATLLELGPKATSMPAFVSWVHLLPPLVQVLRWLEGESESGDSEYLMSSRARDLVERIGPDLEVAGLAQPSVRSLPGASYLPAFVQMIDYLLHAIRPR